MINTDFLRELDHLSFVVRKKVSTAYSGTRRSILRGRGMEAIGYREYSQGDDIRIIDWKVYGRTEKLFVKEFEEEKSLTTHILLDISNSMNFRDKFIYAAMIALGFAYLVTKNNEKFAISTFSQEVNIARPKRGRYYLSESIDTLNSAALAGKTNFGKCMEQYQKVIKSRSLIIIISDFLADIESIKSAIYRLGRNDLILIQVLDKIEKDLDIQGDAKLIDLETDAKMNIYASPRLKTQYQERLNNHIARIKETCSQVGADFHVFTTDMPIFNAILDVISAREARLPYEARRPWAR